MATKFQEQVSPSFNRVSHEIPKKSSSRSGTSCRRWKLNVVPRIDNKKARTNFSFQTKQEIRRRNKTFSEVEAIDNSRRSCYELMIYFKDLSIYLFLLNRKKKQKSEGKGSFQSVEDKQQVNRRNTSNYNMVQLQQSVFFNKMQNPIHSVRKFWHYSVFICNQNPSILIGNSFALEFNSLIHFNSSVDNKSIGESS